MNRRSSACFLVVWCLLSLWLLYDGLELTEELHLLVKIQPYAQDLDMEVLLQLASGLKPDVPTLENRPVQSGIVEAVEPCSLIPAHTICQEDYQAKQIFSPLRLHQRLSVYRI
jgi:hypothetical protein